LLAIKNKNAEQEEKRQKMQEMIEERRGSGISSNR
jgi:hypothetical protein